MNSEMAPLVAVSMLHFCADPSGVDLGFLSRRGCGMGLADINWPLSFKLISLKYLLLLAVSQTIV